MATGEVTMFRERGNRARGDLRGLIEVIDQCATRVAAAGGTGLSMELAHHARRIQADDPVSLARLDELFAWDGPLHVASIVDDWDEEYVGLAAAYRVESENARG